MREYFKWKEIKARQLNRGTGYMKKEIHGTESCQLLGLILIIDWDVGVIRMLKEATLRGSKTDNIPLETR